MKKKKQGRPIIPKRELKLVCSIRLTKKQKKILIKRYGSLQVAIEALIKSDNELWS